MNGIFSASGEPQQRVNDPAEGTRFTLTADLFVGGLMAGYSVRLTVELNGSVSVRLDSIIPDAKAWHDPIRARYQRASEPPMWLHEKGIKVEFTFKNAEIMLDGGMQVPFNKIDLSGTYISRGLNSRWFYHEGHPKPFTGEMNDYIRMTIREDAVLRRMSAPDMLISSGPSLYPQLNHMA